MSILQTLQEISVQNQLPFLLIGGHAMNLLGLSRQTADIDLLVPETDVQKWINHLTPMGYTVFNRTQAFAQLEGPHLEDWPIDLVLVDPETFQRLQAKAVPGCLDDIPIRIPATEHFLALKVHGLKQGGPQRTLKDVEDILHLLACGQLNPHNPTVCSQLDRYGTPEITQTIHYHWDLRNAKK